MVQEKLTRKEQKKAEQEAYEKRVLNYNRVVAIELANRARSHIAPKDSYIAIREVNKIYDNLVQAVYDFSLDIKKNEFIVFVGPSGCGKSTTLRMIAGLEEITSGNLFIDGVYANGIAPKDRNIAMVFQSYALYPHMSVFDNMAFSLKIRTVERPILDKEGKQVYGPDPLISEKLDAEKLEIEKAIGKNAKIDVNKLSSLKERKEKCLQDLGARIDDKKRNIWREEILNLRDDIAKTLEYRKSLKERLAKTEKDIEKNKAHLVPLTEKRRLNKEEISSIVKEAAKILQIEEYLDRKPKALSGGQRQRVALGRAICKKAKLFLMDEPLSNLDAKLRVSMRAEIIRIHKAIGATTIYVTHDQTEAMTMADRIVIMEKGLIKQIGTPKEIYNHPANVFVASFIGSPSMNIYKAKIIKDRVVFDKDNVLLLPKPTIKKIEDSFKKKIAEIDDFLDKGLENERKKELLVKVETLKLHNKKKKIPNLHDEKGNIIDYYSTIKLDEYEQSLCLANFEEEAKRREKAKSIYREMLEKGIYDIRLGIRPEDAYLENAPMEQEVKKSNALRLSVTIPELLGHEYYLHALLGEHDFIFKTSANKEIKEGEKVEVVFDMNKIHIFDDLDEQILV